MKGDSLTLGFLYEGTMDESPLEVLIKRLIGSEKISFLHWKAEGGIIPELVPASKYFFEGAAGKVARFAVFVSDSDGDVEKEKEITKWVKDYNVLYSERLIVIAVPAPCLEEWFIVESDAIKIIYNLKSTEPLPFKEITHPKTRLGHLIGMYSGNDYTMSPLDWYVEFAKNVNLESLEYRDSSFAKFAQELRDVMSVV